LRLRNAIDNYQAKPSDGDLVSRKLAFVEPHPREEYDGNDHHHSPIPEQDAEWFGLMSSRQLTI
jgi:hypothetical protein